MTYIKINVWRCSLNLVQGSQTNLFDCGSRGENILSRRCFTSHGKNNDVIILLERCWASLGRAWGGLMFVSRTFKIWKLNVMTQLLLRTVDMWCMHGSILCKGDCVKEIIDVYCSRRSYHQMLIWSSQRFSLSHWLSHWLSLNVASPLSSVDSVANLPHWHALKSRSLASLSCAG